MQKMLSFNYFGKSRSLFVRGGIVFELYILYPFQFELLEEKFVAQRQLHTRQTGQQTKELLYIARSDPRFGAGIWDMVSAAVWESGLFGSQQFSPSKG